MPRSPSAPARLSLALAALLLITTYAPASAARSLGRWTLQPSSDRSQVQVAFHMRTSDGGDHWNSHSVEWREIEGLDPTTRSSAGAAAGLRLVRDAGTLVLDGRVERGAGSGTFSFEPDPAFVTHLRARGYEAPSEEEQLEFALLDEGFPLIDALRDAHVARPSTSRLLQLGMHGVDVDYVRSMGSLGFHPRTALELQHLRDHGVDAEFVRGLAAYGISDLSLERAVQLRDHGVDPEFVRGLRDAGYRSLSADELVYTRDHGVDPDYIAEMREAGLGAVPLEDMVRARDHGVSGHYVRRMRAWHDAHASLDQIIQWRDRGED